MPTITTPEAGLAAGDVSIATSDVKIPAYRAKPGEGSGFPTIVVVQEIFGVNDHIRDICRRLARETIDAVRERMGF